MAYKSEQRRNYKTRCTQIPNYSYDFPGQITPEFVRQEAQRQKRRDSALDKKALERLASQTVHL